MIQSNYNKLTNLNKAKDNMGLKQLDLTELNSIKEQASQLL